MTPETAAVPLFTPIPDLGIAQVDAVSVRTFDGAAHDFDEAAAIAVDDSCNLYVTGWVYDTSHGYYWLTIKYNPDRGAVWTHGPRA